MLITFVLAPVAPAQTGAVYNRSSPTIDSGGEMSDAGVYDVVATNDCAAVSSSPVSLAVLFTGGGDGKSDGHVTGRDIHGFVDNLLHGSPSAAFCAYDMNGDGSVNSADLPLFINLLTH